jgi:hypothetical protein
LVVDGEDVLVEALVNQFQHPVVFRVVGFNRLKLFDAVDALNAHGLGNFYGIGTPGGDHFFAGPDEQTGQGGGVEWFSVPKKPPKFLNIN